MRAFAYETLKTPFQINGDCPFGEYPRPQFQRDSYLSLNGKWQFDTSPSDTIPEALSREITVPFPMESSLSGIGEFHHDGEYLYYRRSVTLPDGFSGERLLLHFDAVDTVCTVYINKRPVAEHIGGYLPFEVDITDEIEDGKFEIDLRVLDNTDPTYPYGKQKKARGGMWYTTVSGIWQSVWLEWVPKERIESMRITPTLHSVKLSFETTCKGEKRISIDGIETEYAFTENEIEIPIENAHPWSPEDPYLYPFTVSFGTDTVKSYFALREIGTEVIDGHARITLNGKPYFLHALLDQGYFPDGIFLPPSPEGYEYDIKTAKALGFNALRKHIKIEPMIFYHLCDKLGMLVLQDAVNNGKYSFLMDTALPTIGLLSKNDERAHKDPRSRLEYERTLRGMLSHLYNTPSVVYYTIFNEGWGQFSADKMYELARECDPTRIYDATSGWFRRTKSDVDSRHIYFKPLSFKKRDGRALIVSEFGGYSLRVENHLFGSANYGYRRFDSQADFETALLSLYENEVVPAIFKGLCGAVYTQLTDVEDETNGLITYDRKFVKVSEEKMQNLAKKLKI